MEKILSEILPNQQIQSIVMDYFDENFENKDDTITEQKFVGMVEQEIPIPKKLRYPHEKIFYKIDEILPTIVNIYKQKYNEGKYDDYPYAKRIMNELITNYKKYASEEMQESIESEEYPYNSNSKETTLKLMDYILDIMGTDSKSDYKYKFVEDVLMLKRGELQSRLNDKTFFLSKHNYSMFKIIKSLVEQYIDEKGNVNLLIMDENELSNILELIEEESLNFNIIDYKCYLNILTFKGVIPFEYLGWEIAHFIPEIAKLAEMKIITIEGVDVNYTTHSRPHIRGYFKIKHYIELLKIPYVDIELLDLLKIKKKKNKTTKTLYYNIPYEDLKSEGYLEKIIVPKYIYSDDYREQYIDILIEIDNQRYYDYLTNYVENGVNPMMEDIVKACMTAEFN